MPRPTVNETLRALQRDGWCVHRQGGRHLILRHPTKPNSIPLPRHGTQQLPIGTLQNILQLAGLGAADFRKLLEG